MTRLFSIFIGCWMLNVECSMFPIHAQPLVPVSGFTDKLLAGVTRPLIWSDANGCSWSVWKGKTNGPNCPVPITNVTVTASYPCTIQSSTNFGTWKDEAWGYSYTTKPTDLVRVYRGKVEPVFVLCYGYSSGRYDYTASTTAKSITVPAVGSRTVYGRVYAYFGQSMRESPFSSEKAVLVTNSVATFVWQYNGPILAITKG
jgi:hypothetical protein